MHMLSSHNRSEFLATPQLIRFEYAQGSNGFEPTLLIKGSTLLLKYVVLGAPMQLSFRLFDGRLLYALMVRDDGNDGGVLWSFAERDEELNGIRGFASGAPLTVFLFNELAVNVAWNEFVPASSNPELASWATSGGIGPVDHSLVRKRVSAVLSRLHQSVESDDAWITHEIAGDAAWKALYNHFITSDASSSLINLFDHDEGNQQEQLGVWLTDNLHPFGCHHSPQIPKGAGARELTDILLSHEFGAILIESKTLSILARDKLPDRTKLKRDVDKHVSKAFDQLRGGIRKIKSGVEITSKSGRLLSIERDRPAHAIVLVPELDLIDNRSAYGLEFIRGFMEATSAFPHLLDISELLRVVQAVGMMATKGTTTTPLMRFDYYLMERFQKAVAARTLVIKVLLRLVE